MTSRPNRLNAAALDARRFTPAQCDALYAAVLVDDAVDAHTRLPAQALLDHDDDVLLDCFCLSRQLWKTQVTRRLMLDLAATLARDRDLDVAGRRTFKDARAKFKQLRFAFALYGADHRYPMMLDWLTTELGHVQDAFKAGRRAAVGRRAALLRLLLSPPAQARLAWEVDHLRPAGGAGFRRYVDGQVDLLATMLARPELTGAEFHATRKIVSRQGSFQGSLHTLTGADAALLVSRSLSAINGLMGRMHDDLVLMRVSGAQDYHRAGFTLPDDIRGRLTEYVGWYRRAAATAPAPGSSVGRRA